MRAIPAWLLLLLAGSLAGQEPPASRPAAGNADQQRRAVLTWLESPDYFRLDISPRILRLVGHVHVRVGDITLRCQNLVAWGARPGSRGGNRKQAEGRLDRVRYVVREVYAEGQVVIFVDDTTIRADKAYLDATRERGVLIDGLVRMPLETPSGQVPLTVRAGELRMLARNRFQVLDGSATTSPFAEPAWRFKTERAEIIRESPGVREGDPDQKPVTNTRFQAEGNALYLGDFPVIWFPDVGGDTAGGRMFRYVQKVRFGSSNQFGQEIGLVIGDDFDWDGKKAGKWAVLGDWLSKRGFGGGLDVEYRTEGAHGRVLGRYQRDDGKDENFGVPPTKNRGRISLWHRQWLAEKLQLDLELNLFSDRNFLQEFYENDFKQDKPPENLVYLKQAFFNSMLSGSFSGRFNNWLSRTERQPELRWDLVTEPLFDVFSNPLYLSTTVRAGKLRRKEDDALDIVPRASWRADADTLLELPLLAGPLKLTPFGGVRYTWYEKDLRGREDETRFGVTGGATLTTQMFRTFDVSGGLFDLDGLRHVVIPEVTFRHTTGVDLRPGQLVPFDEVDTFANEQVVELRARNLLQTLRHGRERTYVDTIVDLENRIDFFPNPRDNDGHPWGNLETDLVIRFSEDLQLATDFEIDWYGNGLEVFNVAAAYAPGRDLQIYSGFRHFTDTYDVVFAQVNWRPEEKWLTTFESSYDFEEDRGIGHRVSIARLGPDWVLRFTFTADIGEDDFSFRFSFSPRALFDPVEKPGVIGSEPRFLYLRSGLQH